MTERDKDLLYNNAYALLALLKENDELTEEVEALRKFKREQTEWLIQQNKNAREDIAETLRIAFGFDKEQKTELCHD